MVTISGTIKTEPGKGASRKPGPKSDSSLRTVIIPNFAPQCSYGDYRLLLTPLPKHQFATRNGTWHLGHPAHLPQDSRALVAKRVGAETAAKQLGHSSPVITRQFYISKPEIAADVAHVLDDLAQPAEDDSPAINGE